jgi:hypothetical protein
MEDDGPQVRRTGRAREATAAAATTAETAVKARA